MSKYESFFKKMAVSIVNGGKHCSFSNPNNPPCPDCRTVMVFNGGNLKLGDGNWVCEKCGFSFTENDLQPFIDEYYENPL